LIRKKIAIFLVISIVAFGLIWLLAGRKNQAPEVLASKKSRTAIPPGIAVKSPTPVKPGPAKPVAKQLPGGPYEPNDLRWKERRYLRAKDGSYEWKTPISFYGQVLDQDNHPVEGVHISMSWTDMSLKGTSETTRLSDSLGRFEVTGIRGKRFGIRSIAKSGYLEARGSNRYSFEYPGFWEPTYHEPDVNNPVIFRLRKIGAPAPLIASEGKVSTNLGIPAQILLSQNEQIATKITVTVFVSNAKDRKWRAQVSVEDGGIISTLDEFPFNAPISGYQKTLELNQDNPLPSVWHDVIDVGGRFYIKTSEGYGLLELNQIKGKKTLHYRVLINPTGQTNLEPAQS